MNNKLIIQPTTKKFWLFYSEKFFIQGFYHNQVDISDCKLATDNHTQELIETTLDSWEIFDCYLFEDSKDQDNLGKILDLAFTDSERLSKIGLSELEKTFEKIFFEEMGKQAFKTNSNEGQANEYFFNFKTNLSTETTFEPTNKALKELI